MYKTLVSLVFLAAVVAVGVNGQWVQRKTAILEGDLTIGYLFSMHEQPDQKSAHTRHCGRIWEEYGIQRAEATFQTIETINADPDILPGIKLGVEIRDDCWYAPVALEQTLEFIRDAVAPNATKMTSSVIKCPADASLSCPNKRKVLVGVIGPGSSAVSIQVQNLLQLFHIPQIGYSATSRDLSDKNRFGYFLRVVPPDELQAKAMLQVVEKYNWTYVSAVSTEGSYGQSGLQVFREYAHQADICIAKEYSILSNDAEAEYDKLLNRLLEEPKARVVVCFCEGDTVHAIFKAIRRFNRTGHFLLVGSDGWADRLDVVQGYEAEADGGISIRIHSPKVDTFDEGYFNLKPDFKTRQRNPWFQEFWEHRFDCSMSPASGHMNKICSGQEDLKTKYKQDSKLGFVIKASLAMANALDRLQKSVCGLNASGLCPAMLPVDGSLLRDHLMNVSFYYGNETVQFDSNGNPPGWYDIMNFQKQSVGVGKYNYVQIGSWKNGTLELPDEPGKMVTSVCSEPCLIGQVKIIQKELSCCWQCQTCEFHQRVFNETTCQDCLQGWLPDANKTECEEIAAEFNKWSDGASIAAVTLSLLGLLATLATAIVFAWHNNTPVVKASTRELTYIILFGMALCYATTFTLLAVPDRFSCTMSRIMPGLSFSLIFASLLTKTNRIARILAGSKKRIRTSKPRWLSLTAQILITLTLIGIEVILIVVMLILEPAEAVKHFPSRREVMIICNTTPRGLLFPLSFDFFLIGMCTVYAVKTRNLPENFNEAKFIGFAMYTTCVIWVAFGPIYFSASKSQTITLCFCVSLSAAVALILLFGPKLYIILFKPEKNNRSAFTTTADLRIHIAGPATIKSSSAAHHRSSTATPPHNWVQSSSSCDHQQVTRRPSNRTLEVHQIDPTTTAAAGRNNMTFLKRAFGSQLDLAGDKGLPRVSRRSFGCQTDEQRTSSSSSSSISSNNSDPCSHSWRPSITEKRRSDDEQEADIIISLMGKDSDQDEAYLRLQSMGITVSNKGSSDNIL